MINNFFNLLYPITYFLLASITLYLNLYTKLDLEKNVKSFIYFFFNLVIISFYIYMSVLVFCGKLNSIYLEQYSWVSAIRQFLFVVLSVIICILLLLLKFKKIPPLQRIIDRFSEPKLMQEVENILRTGEERYFGPFFEEIIQKTQAKYFYKVCLFFVHIFFFVVLPLFQIGILINFTFFKGDLKYIFYLMPFFLLSFLYKNLFFYFKDFIYSNISGMHNFIIVDSPYAAQSNNDQFVGVDFNKIKIYLKEEKKEELLKNCEVSEEILLKNIAYTYLTLITFRYILYQLNQINFFMGPLFLFLRWICSFELASAILFKTSLTEISLGFSYLAKVARPQQAYHIIKRPYATELYLLNKIGKKEFAKKYSDSAFQVNNHMVAVNTSKADVAGFVAVYCQVTKGSANGKAKELHAEKDGSNKPSDTGTGAVYEPEGTTLPKVHLGDLSSPLPGSKEFFENEITRQNDKKNDPKNYSEDKHD